MTLGPTLDLDRHRVPTESAHKSLKNLANKQNNNEHEHIHFIHNTSSETKANLNSMWALLYMLATVPYWWKIKNVQKSIISYSICV